MFHITDFILYFKFKFILQNSLYQFVVYRGDPVVTTFNKYKCLNTFHDVNTTKTLLPISRLRGIWTIDLANTRLEFYPQTSRQIQQFILISQYFVFRISNSASRIPHFTCYIPYLIFCIPQFVSHILWTEFHHSNSRS